MYTAYGSCKLNVLHLCMRPDEGQIWPQDQDQDCSNFVIYSCLSPLILIQMISSTTTNGPLHLHLLMIGLIQTCAAHTYPAHVQAMLQPRMRPDEGQYGRY